MGWFWNWLALAACENDCSHLWYADRDGDGFGARDERTESCERPAGYVADATDCDDASAAVHPEAIDLCNGLDDDCDGMIDPDATIWYADADGDGWGNNEIVFESCFAPDHSVPQPGDCDDQDATVHPEAEAELCDGQDQDCDGLVDEEAPGAELWFPDEDGDGFGAEGQGVAVCVPPPGWVTFGLDCADLDPLRNPIATEQCNDIDDDCDGLADLADPEGVVGTLVLFPDLDEDGFGTPVASVGCAVQSFQTLVTGDCDDEDNAVNPDATEACNERDDDCDFLVDDSDPSLDVSTAITTYADADGDGYGDPTSQIAVCVLGVGAVTNDLDCDDDDPDIGPDLWILDGDGDGFGAGVPLTGTACAPPADGYLNLARAGDCDDNDATFRPGAPDACADGIDHDCSTVDPACGAPFAGIESLEERGRTWADGVAIGAGFGRVGVGGDLDGDGAADVVVGAPTAGGLGEVTVFAGPPPESGAPWLARATLSAVDGGAFGATALLVPGDPGTAAHLVIGAPEFDTDLGRIYVYQHGADTVTTEISGAGGIGSSLVAVSGGEAPTIGFGSATLALTALLTVDFAAGVQPANTSNVILRGVAGSSFGTALAASPDGLFVAIGDPETAATGGAVWVFDAALSGDLAADGVQDARFTADVADDGLGAAVAAGDFDGDGRPDFAGSAPNDDTAATDAGVVYVWTAGGDGDAATLAGLEVRGDGLDARIGQAVALADLDNDGLPELVFGAAEVDIGGTDSGAVYVFSGGRTGVWDALSADAVWYGPAGGRAGEWLGAAPIDVDPGVDLWVGVPGTPFGAAWYVAGPMP